MRVYQEALGVGRRRPRLSWELGHSEANQYQSAHCDNCCRHRGLVSGEKATCGIVVRSSVPVRRILSMGARNQVLPEILLACSLVDQDDNPSPYSNIAVFETAFLGQDEWEAIWIGNRDDTLDSVTVQSNYNLRPGALRKELSIQGDKTS